MGAAPAAERTPRCPDAAGSVGPVALGVARRARPAEHRKMGGRRKRDGRSQPRRPANGRGSIGSTTPRCRGASETGRSETSSAGTRRRTCLERTPRCAERARSPASRSRDWLTVPTARLRRFGNGGRAAETVKPPADTAATRRRAPDLGPDARRPAAAGVSRPAEERWLEPPRRFGAAGQREQQLFASPEGSAASGRVGGLRSAGAPAEDRRGRPRPAGKAAMGGTGCFGNRNQPYRPCPPVARQSGDRGLLDGRASARPAGEWRSPRLARSTWPRGPALDPRFGEGGGKLAESCRSRDRPQEDPRQTGPVPARRRMDCGRGEAARRSQDRPGGVAGERPKPGKRRPPRRASGTRGGAGAALARSRQEPRGGRTSVRTAGGARRTGSRSRPRCETLETRARFGAVMLPGAEQTGRCQERQSPGTNQGASAPGTSRNAMDEVAGPASRRVATVGIRFGVT
jgi:hypothetical protein